MANARTPTRLQGQASRKSPAPVQTLSGEAVLDALKMILVGAPLNEVLTAVTHLVEAHSLGMSCSICLVEEDGLHLRYAAAPNLPEAYRAATEGACIGPDAGSCGTVAYLRQSVFVADILSDPKWAHYRDVALQSGLRAAWSSPIMAHDGKVLGTFCMYYREVRHPEPAETDQAIVVVSPCGSCRELIWDYDRNARVIVPSANGPVVAGIGELLPNKYSRERTL